MPKPIRGAFNDLPTDAPSGVLKVVAILKCFTSDQAELGVSEIARQLDLHKSTVSRVLATLEAVRFVERDGTSGRYRAGGGILALAAPMMARLRIEDVAKPVLARLAQQTGETANLSVWDGAEVFVIDQVIGPGPIQHVSTPGRSPAHCTATGKALLAASGDSVVKAAIARGLKRYTEKTIVKISAFRTEIDKIRRIGYATNDEELMKDVYAISAAVRGFDGTPRAAVSVAMPRFRATSKATPQIAAEVVKAARELSLSMGWDGRSVRPRSADAHGQPVV